MLETKVSPVEFRKCLHEYLAELSLGTATGGDLCRIFSRVSGVDLEPYFKAWTMQSNFPLVVLDDDGVLRQYRFLKTGMFEDRKWIIPLEILYGKGDEVHREIISLEGPFKVPEGCEWIRINADSKTLCRVWQKGNFFKALLNGIENGRLSAIDRSSILLDYQALAQAGLISYTEVVALLQTYRKESNGFVAAEISRAFRQLLVLFSDPAGKLRNLARSVLKAALDGIGIEPKPGESVTAQLARSGLLWDLAFLCPEESVVNYLKQQWPLFLTDRPSLNPDIYDVVAKAGARYCDGFDELLKLNRTDPSPELKRITSQSLGFSPSARTREVLELGLKAQLQDVSSYLHGVVANPDTGRALWDFMKEKWAFLDESFGTMAFTIPSLIEAGTRPLVKEDEAKEVEDFFREHPTPIGERAANLAVAAIRNRAAVLARDSAAMAQLIAGLTQ
jgi:aminopeptidase N